MVTVADMTERDVAVAGLPGGGGSSVRRWATRLLLFQAAAFVVFTLLLVLVAYQDPNAWISLPIACYTALTSALLFAVGAWLRRSRWARGPGVVLELLQLLTGCWVWLAGAPVLGGPLVLLGLVGAALLLAPYHERT
jgi:hypothetical protein